MKVNKYYLFMSIIFIIICVCKSQNILEQYNPIHIAGEAALKKDWPLNQGDYLTIIKASICSIPVFGAMIDGIFSVIWKKIFPPREDPYLTKEEFEKRITGLINDMRNFSMRYTDKAIEQYTIETSNLQSKVLYELSEEYQQHLKIYAHQMRSNKETTATFKRNFPAIYYLVFYKLKELLVMFGDDSRIHLLGKLYIETAFLYQALLRDSHFNGVNYGINPEVIKGLYTSNVSIESFARKTSDHASQVVTNYANLLSKMIDLKIKENPKCLKFRNDPKCKNEAYSIPQWNSLVSLIHYSDLLLVPGTRIRSEEVPAIRNQYITFENTIIDLTEQPPKLTYTMDFSLLGKYVTKGEIGSHDFDGSSQWTDFVTDSTGYLYTANNNMSIQDGPRFVDSNEPLIYGSAGNYHENANFAIFGQNFHLNPKAIKSVKFRIYFTTSNLFNEYDNRFEFRLIESPDNTEDLILNDFWTGESSPNTYKGHFDKNYYLNPKSKSKFNDSYKIVSISKGIGKVTPRYYLETESFTLKKEKFLVYLRPRGLFSVYLLTFDLITS
ncbi:hypothetical protein RB653_008306 [Dictyostelium firmibasis]|uniref:Pesticidal crystal protein N-terminal domain-containing protein n=1 Tax=Dictyostelium firmibasis TaxID=79012 RepID=A0AAN7TSE3_9MYCE